MKINNIVVDSNFFIKDYNLNSRETTQLIRIKDYYKIKLAIPDVVYDECLWNYKKETIKAHADISVHLEKYKKILVQIEKTKIDIDEFMDGLAALSNYYKPKIDRFIENNNINKIPYPNINHKYVVEKMYEGEAPFKQDKTEVGYKDFLIINSIKEHIDPKEITVILSRNVRDFCTQNGSNKENKLVPVSKKLDMDNVYLVDNISILIDVLSKDLALENIQPPWEREEIEEFLKSAIDDPLYTVEIYGEFSFLANNKKNIIVSITELQAQQADVQDGYVEITGIMKIQMDYSFEINQFIFPSLDKEFVFYDAVIDAMQKFKYTENNEDFWEIKFNDYNFCREFNFSITDYSYNPGKSIKEAFLSLDPVVGK